LGLLADKETLERLTARSRSNWRRFSSSDVPAFLQRVLQPAFRIDGLRLSSRIFGKSEVTVSQCQSCSSGSSFSQPYSCTAVLFVGRIIVDLPINRRNPITGKGHLVILTQAIQCVMITGIISGVIPRQARLRREGSSTGRWKMMFTNRTNRTATWSSSVYI
jgi:hypothetical protein